VGEELACATFEATLPEKGALNFGASEIWLKLLIPVSDRDEAKKLVDWQNRRLGVSIVPLKTDDEQYRTVGRRKAKQRKQPGAPGV